jgi:hypothetical protein
MHLFGWICTGVGVALLAAGGVFWLNDSIMKAASIWFSEIADRELRAV